MDLPGKPKSLWFETTSNQSYPALDTDLAVDVAIVGGGITGLTAALLLKRAGKSVAVVEANRIGGGVTGHTTAHLTTMLDTRYQDLVSSFGQQGARLAAESSREAIERIAALVTEERIKCDFARVPGYLYAESSRDLKMLERECETARELGLAVEMVTDVPLPFPLERAIRFEDQAQFHPLKYIQALAKAVAGDGGQIFEQTRVREVSDGEPCRIRTERGSLVAKSVIVATHVPINDLLFPSVVAPYRSYVLGVRLDERAPVGLFWDTADPYHYIRSHPSADGEIVIVGGADHKTGQEDDTGEHYRQLETFVRSRFKVKQIVYRWSSQVYEPVDGLPYIGTYPHDTHVFVATGYSGTGMTFGTLAAMILTDAILGRVNPWSELYSTTRVKPLASARRFIAEGVNTAAHAVGGWLARPEVDQLADVRPGEGRIVEVEGAKVAAYRDAGGTLHTLSPVCRHAGCIVGWNDAEKTWDCPCHGGRYKATGEVIEGPPSSNLEPKSLAR